MKSNLKRLEPVILAGGFGKRLWPISRSNKPKQFHSFVGKYSLFQDTLIRLKKIGFESVTVITNRENIFLAEYQAKDIEINCDFICEPESKNTAPALALASIHLKERNKIMFVIPSDHFISNVSSFKKTILSALDSSRDNKIVLLGVNTKFASTEYGYIKIERNKNREKKVILFSEKPELNVAQKYHKSKNYYWNSGMLILKPNVYIEELSKYRPKILRSVKSSFTKKNNKIFVDPKEYSKSPSDSIDYAVLEKTNRAFLLELETDWNDLGTWDSIYDANKKDPNKNLTKGKVFLSNTKDSIIFSEDKLLVTLGLKQTVVLNTEDALVISTRDDIDKIPNILKKIEKKEPKINENKEVLKPWGKYKTLILNDGFQVKVLTINHGHRLSLQKHSRRSEHWSVVSGKGEVTKNNQKTFLEKDQSIYFDKNDIHSIFNPFKEDLVIVEVQVGDYLGEDDIERLEDIYGRN